MPTLPRPTARRSGGGALLLGAALALALPAAATAQAPSAATAAPAAAGIVYTIDPNHSELRFRIRHLVSRVSGTFDRWKGTITVADPARWEDAAIEVAIETASIDTNNESRDADLRSESFFDAANHPTITFRSTRIERSGERARIHGDLTVRGVTKPVVLEGAFLGSTRAASGRERVGFEVTTTIDRLDYGITWNRVVEGGGVTLGDEVRIEITVGAERR